MKHAQIQVVHLYGAEVPRRRRMYVVELESLSLSRDLSDAQVGLFSESLRTNRRIENAAPSADPERSVFELRASVEATGPANAMAVAEVAFEAALHKAGLAADIALANVWIAEPDARQAAI